MPLVAALRAEIMDSLGPSPGYAPSELDLVPEEDVKMLEVVDTCMVLGMPAHRPS